MTDMLHYNGILVLYLFGIPTLASIAILTKAGYSRWYAILMAIPVLNAILIWLFARKQWPNVNEIPQLGFDALPWSRRSDVNSVLILLSVITGGLFPGILIVCINILGGDIYFNKEDTNGDLKKWHWSNKLIALLLLALNVIWISYMFLR